MTIITATGKKNNAACDGHLDGTILRIGCVMSGALEAGQRLDMLGEEPLMLVQQLQDTGGWLDDRPGSCGNYLVRRL